MKAKMRGEQSQFLESAAVFIFASKFYYYFLLLHYYRFGVGMSSLYQLLDIICNMHGSCLFSLIVLFL
jgi:hypothetical protein